MANADTTSDVLLNTGFGGICFQRHDTRMLIGRHLDHAVAYVMALGPAGEAIRLAPDEEVERLRSALTEAVRGARWRSSRSLTESGPRCRAGSTRPGRLASP
jgi:hypothetical protein